MVDGGTVWDVNVSTAISNCRMMTESDEDITIDMIATFRREPPQNTVGNTRHNWQVKKDIHKVWNTTLDYNIQFKACPKCNFRWIIAGNHHDVCQPDDPRQLDFNGSATWCLQE